MSKNSVSRVKDICVHLRGFRVTPHDGGLSLNTFFKIVFDVRNCVWTPRLGNDGKNTKNQNFFEILNGRLALEDGSDRCETLGKRVSDDLEHFIFPRWKKISDNKNSEVVLTNGCFWRSFKGWSVSGRCVVKSYCL